MAYWLFKSEPSAYSIDDLNRDGTTPWSGVRNYQARNFMRDTMRIGDLGFFYHSNCDVLGIVGIVKVCSEAYPDFTAWDPDDKHFDASSPKERPRWMMVDVALVEKWTKPVTLPTLKAHPELAKTMRILQKGNRLSITPVTETEWKTVLAVGNFSITLIRPADEGLPTGSR
ncbi:MAG: EVE domain-containing protein [Gammaproteobacteria bacterium RIFCSPHIGHO2_12_FULL_45_9]|nr:MAG: EVE domain-containing protein [Gammaproteobacteria bacterium RIFCSPHIGHO2_12_FULL_45_9]